MSNSNFESGSRASKRPDRTVEEATQLLYQWQNIANDFEVFNENYNTEDPRIRQEFLLAKFPSQEELQKALADIKLLRSTILAGTTAQRDQISLHYTFERLVRLRDSFRGRFNRLHIRLRSLGLPDPEDDDETNAQQPAVSSQAMEPPSIVPARGQRFTGSTNTDFRPQHPIETMAQLPAHIMAQPPIPTLRQRLMPRYIERPVSPPAPEPPLQFPSENYSGPYYTKGTDGVFRPVEDELDRLQAENQALRRSVQNDQNRVEAMKNISKMREEKIKAQAAEIARLQAELEKEKNKKK